MRKYKATIKWYFGCPMPTKRKSKSKIFSSDCRATLYKKVDVFCRKLGNVTEPEVEYFELITDYKPIKKVTYYLDWITTHLPEIVWCRKESIPRTYTLKAQK